MRLERIEETTNKISLALEVPEEGARTPPGRFRARRGRGQDATAPLIGPSVGGRIVRRGEGEC